VRRTDGQQSPGRFVALALVSLLLAVLLGKPAAQGREGGEAAPLDASPEVQMATGSGMFRFGKPPSGVKLYPPPGTNPLLSGIIVPEGFDLPSGYERHYQTTDDGRELPPILLFAPGFQPTDAQGRPVPVPGNRVVPPHLAPAGMPIRLLEIPGQRPERP
jgi:hypothetical protein